MPAGKLRNCFITFLTWFLKRSFPPCLKGVFSIWIQQYCPRLHPSHRRPSLQMRTDLFQKDSSGTEVCSPTSSQFPARHHNRWLQKLVTAFPLAFISIQLLTLVMVQLIPAFSLENAMNFSREMTHLNYKYWSGFFVVVEFGFFAGVVGDF